MESQSGHTFLLLLAFVSMLQNAIKSSRAISRGRVNADLKANVSETEPLSF
jgi:hypothetical protein